MLTPRGPHLPGAELKRKWCDASRTKHRKQFSDSTGSGPLECALYVKAPLDGRVRSSILALHSFRGCILHPGYLSLWVWPCSIPAHPVLRNFSVYTHVIVVCVLPWVRSSRQNMAKCSVTPGLPSPNGLAEVRRENLPPRPRETNLVKVRITWASILSPHHVDPRDWARVPYPGFVFLREGLTLHSLGLVL